MDIELLWKLAEVWKAWAGPGPHTFLIIDAERARIVIFGRLAHLRAA